MILQTIASIIWTCFFVGSMMGVFVVVVDLKKKFTIVPLIFGIIMLFFGYMSFILMLNSWGVM